MAKGLIDLILDKIFDADWVGRRGEKLTERELKWVRLFGRDGKILRNVYVPKEDGETSEIDIMYITQKGIFVMESKNYSGWIFGDEKASYWTVMLPNKQKNKLYNPIMQNKTHIRWLAKYVGEEIPMFSIIVFSERCELKKVTVDNSEVHVIKRDRTYATIREIWEAHPDALSMEQVENIYTQLSLLTNVDEAVKQAHIDDINRKYKKTPQTQSVTNEAESSIAPEDNNDTKKCPRCGKELVIRVAKKGENAGNQFYGCSGFPKCRYMEDIEK